MQLRPYQEEAKNAILDQWDQVRSTLLVLPTGTGKTIVFAKLTEDRVREGARVLILAHRDELIRQAQDKLLQATGIISSIEKAGETAEGEWTRVTCGSVQTLMSAKRLARFSQSHYDYIIIDEAHHALSQSYQKVVEYFNTAKVLGVTATPDRGDKKNLGQVFESIAYEYSLHEAIRSGYLVPIKALTLPLDINLKGIGTQAGDYKVAELGDALGPYLNAIADEMVKHCMNRKTIIFLPLIATSKKMQEILNAKGFRCGEVNGESKDRKQVLADFHNDKYNVLCNSMLLTEGYDEPSVDCVVCLRPTKVRALYSQIVGRGTRLSPETGKKELLLLDFLWHTDKHELCRPAHLIAQNEHVAKKMIENAEEKAKEGFEGMLDLEFEEDQAKLDVIEERESALADKLADQKKRKRKLVDPLQFSMSIQAEDLVDYEPTMPSEMGPASQKQLAYLEKNGVFPEEIQNSGMASKLIDRLKTRKLAGLTTAKQIRFLEQKGFGHVGTWQFESARKLIDRIAGNRWQVPHDINKKTYHPEKQS